MVLGDSIEKHALKVGSIFVDILLDNVLLLGVTIDKKTDF